MFRKSLLSLFSVLLIALPGCSTEQTLVVESLDQSIDVDVLFIGASAISEDEAWLSGTGGTVAKTVDGGATWTTQVLPGADSLQIRDINAISSEIVYALSIGSGSQSRIFKTTDGGMSWDVQFVNQDSSAFFDCLDFWDAEAGFAFSDAVDGEFVILRTEDGGQFWTAVSPEYIPDASPGEGSFAASGTCVKALGDSIGLIGTGAGEQARVLRSTDRGATWESVETPIVGGTGTTGITSIAFFDSNRGLVLGGDVADHESRTANVAFTIDGGQTWNPGGPSAISGAYYGSAVVPGATTPTVIGVGPKGMDYSTDYGMTWTNVDTLTYWSATFASPTVGWTVGPGGRITKWKMYSSN